jgi:hypothetical protein
MDVQATTEIRELTAKEMEAVTGGWMPRAVTSLRLQLTGAAAPPISLPGAPAPRP